MDRDANRALLLEHIEGNPEQGIPLAELQQAFHFLSRDQIQTLLKELKAEGHIHSIGRTKGGRWYPGGAPR